MGVKYNRTPPPKEPKLDKEKSRDWSYTGIEGDSDNVVTLVNAMQSVDTNAQNDNATHITTTDGEKIEYNFNNSRKKTS